MAAASAQMSHHVDSACACRRRRGEEASKRTLHAHDRTRGHLRCCVGTNESALRRTTWITSALQLEPSMDRPRGTCPAVSFRALPPTLCCRHV